MLLPFEASGEDMAFVAPAHSKKRVDAAGDVLISPNAATEPQRQQALAVVNNWRSAHAYPLHSITELLRQRVRPLDYGALIAKRMKRLTSIEAKLMRFPTMRLSKMQDIGGCRAVVDNIEQLKDLIALYRRRDSGKDNNRSCLIEEYDYLTHPKDSGYRSHHLVYKYYSKTERHAAFNSLRIELQLRSAYQHAWATALETVDTFRGDALKSSMGDPAWARFFAVMGSMVAMVEGTPRVPDTPQSFAKLRNELQTLDKRLNAVHILEGLYVTIKHIVGVAEQDAKLFLLRLDPTAREIQITGYTERQAQAASEAAIGIEKATLNDDRGIQVVLVSVDSVTALPQAYPNFYLDTKFFVQLVKLALSGKGDAPDWDSRWSTPISAQQ